MCSEYSGPANSWPLICREKSPSFWPSKLKWPPGQPIQKKKKRKEEGEEREERKRKEGGDTKSI